MKHFTLLVFLFTGYFLFSQKSICGDWVGHLETQGSRLKIVFHITSQKNVLSGTMDSPDQGAYGLNMNSVTFTDPSVLFDLSVFGIKYQGSLVQQDSISGEFFQGEFTTTLNLKKSATSIASRPNRPQEPKTPFPYGVKEVKFTNETAGITLAGTLTMPKGKGPFPAVILITGSGAQNRDEEILNHKPFLVLSDYLTRNGVAVLRYDDRGVGQSGGKFDGATTSDFAYDAQAAYNFLSKTKKINKQRIGIIGHSEGAMVANMVAAADSTVKFIVLLAGPGIPIDQLMLKQTEVTSRFAGISEEEIAISLELNRKFYDILLNEQDDDRAREQIEQIVREHQNSMPVEISKQISDELPQLTRTMLSPWFRYFINFNPEHFLRQINCPVLAINGSKDCQVSAIENLDGIRKSVKETNNKNVYTYIMPDLNHLMQHCETGSVNEYIKIEETFSEEVMKIMTDWIKNFEIIR
ncbi:MAG: alpha/beta hydrolase [Crocinitomicaceae bacterium]|jgi:pimeloyl-ACP methyl ester carboxylesterase|nr:alpha/beta hydrolase [Crocinitomicaceae bacterium]